MLWLELLLELWFCLSRGVDTNVGCIRLGGGLPARPTMGVLMLMMGPTLMVGSVCCGADVLLTTDRGGF